MAMVADSDGNVQRWLCHGWEREKKIGEGVWGFQYFSGRDLFSCLTEKPMSHSWVCQRFHVVFTI